MIYNKLGRTGIDVSAVALGTAPLGQLFGPMSISDAARIVDEALDGGINMIDTSAYYGDAEERLGQVLTPAKRAKVILNSKAGRYGEHDFDFSPARIRSSLENSLRLLNTDYVDVFMLHDIEFVPLGPIFTESYGELQKLKEEGKCRFIGMSGYPIKTFTRVMRETDVDVVLTYAKGTLLDDSLTTELLPVAEEEGVGLINAAAVSLGLLTAGGSKVYIEHPAPLPVRESAARMIELATSRGVDIAFLANQYSIQRSGAATTMVGPGLPEHVQSALAATTTPIDEELLAEILALRAAPEVRRWHIGLDENN